MRVLIACEESQTVCKAFRERGHEAYSCDIQECSGGHPEWHIMDDVMNVIDTSLRRLFFLQNGSSVGISNWDMMIAFPPCTDLAVSGAASFEEKRKDGRQKASIEFFLSLTRTNIEKWAIENPIGIMSTEYRKPDQIVNPFYFGDPFPKKTCLWLFGLKKLVHIKQDDLFYSKTHVEPQVKIYKSKKNKSGFSKYSPKHGVLGKGKGKLRSKFEPGFAKAMAEQWG